MPVSFDRMIAKADRDLARWQKVIAGAKIRVE